MKIMLVAIGTAGDVFPFIGLGQSLGERGHEVHLLSLGIYRAFAESAGLAFHEISGVNGVSDHPNFYHPTQSIKLIARHVLLPSIRPVYEIISRLNHQEWAVISDQVSFGVRIAQEQLKFPLTTCIVSPFMLRSIHQLPVLSGRSFPSWMPKLAKQALMGIVSGLWDSELAPAINQFRQSLGFGPVRDIIYKWSLSAERVVGLFPPWFAKRAPDWPTQFTHGSFSRIVDTGDRDDLQALGLGARDFRCAGPQKPTIAFCAGSAGSAATHFFETAITASVGRSWRSVLVAPKFVSSRRLPSNVIQCGYLPLARLFGKVDVVVHHGGLGTISHALANGVRQIVMPFGHDQFDNAHRVQQLGVGTTLAGTARWSALVSCIETVHRDNSMLERCSAFSQALVNDERANQTAAKILGDV